MKRSEISRTIVAIAMMLIGWLPSLAHDFEVDGIYYNEINSSTVEVTHRGYSTSNNSYAGAVVIPSSVDYNGATYSVTSIGVCAFYECKSLTSIEIPNSVTSIGNYAFYGCTSLTSIEIPNSVTSIEGYAFYYCSSLTSIVIPNSVTSIGVCAFQDCYSLTGIEIPNSVISIGDSAFGGCSSLFKITCLATNPPTIESDTFNSYSAELYVPAGCISAYQSANYWKYFNIKELPIILSTFIALKKPSYISFTMDQVTLKRTGGTDNGNPKIDGFTYDIIDAVTSIGAGQTVPSYNNSSADLRVYANGTMTLSTTDGTNFENIVFTIPSSGYGQSRLAPITASEGAVTLDKSAWTVTWTGSASEVTFTVGAKSDWGTGSGKAGRFVVSAMKVTTGGVSLKAHDFEVDGIFYKKTSDNTAAVSYKGNYWYSYSNEYIGDVVIPSSVKYNGVTYSVTSIGDDALYDCDSLTSVEIPNSVTSIGESAFEECSSLTSVEIGNSVTSIGDGAFAYCSSLTSVEIGNSVTSIGDSAFRNCYSLTGIEIPNSVTSIGYEAFRSCSSLTSIEIPNSVTSIRYSAFYGCSSLTSVVWNAIKCSDFYSNDIPFENCPNIISFTFGDEVEYIPEYLCYNLSKLTSIEIGNSVTSIGNSAFYGCDSLTSVVWNVKKCSDFKNLENRPFKANNITSFTFGDEVEHIPAYLCYRMENLTNIEIPNSVISIGESAFSNGERLTIVVLGNSLTSIEKDAFKGCDNIKKIESKATKAPTIENEDQFSENVYANADLFVPIGYEDNYKYAYAWSEFHNIKGTDFSVKATSISLDKNEVSLKPTQTVVLTETIQPYDTSNKKVTWSSSDESVATIDANGLVTAIAVGEATITATTTDGSNLSATCKVIVVPTLAESITLDKTEISLEATETATLIATILPELATDKSVKWSSSNEAIAVVDENGVVTAIALGEAVITATTTDGSNLSASCKVTVVPTLAVSIELDQTEASVEEKSEFQLTATILPEHTTNKEVAWSSSKKVIATVDETGLVFVKSVGEVVITATTTDGSNLSASCKIIVKPTLATSITLDYSEYEIVEKSDFQLTATILPESTKNKGVVWSSSDMWVASVDENGLVRAYSVGEATITATTTDGSDLSASCKVTVVSSLAQSITLDKTEVSLKATETTTLVATVLPENATEKSVEWSSSNESIATVDENGVVTAIAVGDATITATTTDGSNLSASCKVTVVPTLAESITLDKTEISLEATETATLIATVLRELTTNKSVTWTSFNEAVATVDENGVVTAVAVGEAVITATTVDGSNLSASCKVTVIPTLAVSIELDQTEASVEEKSYLQLTATILPEHTTNKEVAWSSSKKVIATVDETGLVFVKSVGEVVITATTTDGTNLSATCRINVYSGIDGVNGDDVIVATVGDNIVVKNAKLGSIVNVYASNGALVASEEATDGSVVVEAPVKGVYVVKVGKQTVKVII